MVAVFVFGKVGNVGTALGQGWSIEEEFAWAVGPESDLTLKLPGDGRTYTLHCHVHPVRFPRAVERQRLTVLAGDNVLADMTVSERTTVAMPLPRGLTAGQTAIRLRLVHPDAVRPSDHEVMHDGRMLTLCFHWCILTGHGGDAGAPDPCVLDPVKGLMAGGGALDPWAADLQRALAAALESEACRDGTADALFALLTLDPGKPATYLRLVNALLRIDRIQEAVEAAQLAVDFDPTLAAARITLSRCLQQQGRTQEALAQAYTAAVRDPMNAQAYAHLGHILREANEPDVAEQAFRRAILLQPDSAQHRHELSGFLAAIRRFPDAIAAAREAVQLDPANPRRLAHVAHILAQSNDLPQARIEQRRAVNMAPRSSGFRLVLSDYSARAGDLPEALTEARIAVEMTPEDASAVAHLAHIKQMMGDLDEAEVLLRRAVQLSPHDDQLLRQHTLMQARIGKSSAV